MIVGYAVAVAEPIERHSVQVPVTDEAYLPGTREDSKGSGLHRPQDRQSAAGLDIDLVAGLDDQDRALVHRRIRSDTCESRGQHNGGAAARIPLPVARAPAVRPRSPTNDRRLMRMRSSLPGS